MIESSSSGEQSPDGASSPIVSRYVPQRQSAGWSHSGCDRVDRHVHGSGHEVYVRRHASRERRAGEEAALPAVLAVEGARVAAEDRPQPTGQIGAQRSHEPVAVRVERDLGDHLPPELVGGTLELAPKEEPVAVVDDDSLPVAPLRDDVMNGAGFLVSLEGRHRVRVPEAAAQRYPLFSPWLGGTGGKHAPGKPGAEAGSTPRASPGLESPGLRPGRALRRVAALRAPPLSAEAVAILLGRCSRSRSSLRPGRSGRF